MLTVTVDGVSLDDPEGRWWASDDTTETTIPALNLTSLNGPGMVGEIDAPSPGYGASLWPLVVGYEGSNYAEVQQHRAILEATLLQRHKTATYTMAMGGWSREAQGMVIGAEAQRLGSGDRVDVTYQVRIPSGRWLDTVASTVILDGLARTSGDAQDGTYLLTPLLGGSRDMDPTITAVGNGSTTDVRVTDVASGQWVRIAGDIVVGAPIVINPLALSATAGGVPVSGLLDFSARDLHLSPGAVVRVQQNGTQPVTIKARRAYA